MKLVITHTSKDPVTGVTAVVMTAKMDAGDIIAQKTTPMFPGENAGELEKRLASMGAELLAETLNRIETGSATYTKQNEEEVTFAPKLKVGFRSTAFAQIFQIVL